MTVAASPVLRKSVDDVDVDEPLDLKAPVIGAVVVALEILMAVFGRGATRFQLSTGADLIQIPVLDLPARRVVVVMVVAAGAITAALCARALRRAAAPVWMTLLLGLSFVVSFLTWAGAGRSSVVPLVTILSSTLALSVPLVFGGLAGVVGERSGTINIAIEGQLLGGAFLAAVVASASGSPWAGLLAAPPAGILVALLLALFGLKYRVNQIVVGVVLNVLVSGLTGFLFSTVLSDSGSLNRAMRLSRLPVPGLSHVPVLGPVLFNQTILVYAMYAAVGILSLMLFRSRWGLRMRAVGEHPRAADTVGIAVMRTRVNNLVLGGPVLHQGHLRRQRLHRAGGHDPGGLEPAGHPLGGPALRLRHLGGPDPVRHRLAHSDQLHPHDPLRGDDPGGGRVRRQGPAARRGGRALPVSGPRARPARCIVGPPRTRAKGG